MKEKEEYITSKLDEELSEILDGYNVNYGIQKVDLKNMTVTVEFTLHHVEAEDNDGVEYIGLTSW